MSSCHRTEAPRERRSASRRGSGRRVLATRLAVLCALSSAGIGLAVACGTSARERPKAAPVTHDAGPYFDVPGDGTNFCGNEIHQVLGKPPLLYFVMDASGSMSEPAVGQKTRYDVLRESSIDLVKNLGASIRVGAAVFPRQATANDACVVGAEVMAAKKGGGSTTTAFSKAIDVVPDGGTPTAATLSALAPKFAHAFEDPSGPQAVLLVTDGGPNCNLTLDCDAASCIPNIDGGCPVANCCDPALGGTGGNCIDRSATLQAIHDIVQGGAHVYVIGLAGSSSYETTLDQMALVGGVPQNDPPYYYRVDDLSKLEDTFHAIAASLISCEFTLADPPKQQGLTNVYLDGALLYQDPLNGWVWDGTDKVLLVGNACAELKSGQVQDVQVITGCPTETPK